MKAISKDKTQRANVIQQKKRKTKWFFALKRRLYSEKIEINANDWRKTVTKQLRTENITQNESLKRRTRIFFSWTLPLFRVVMEVNEGKLKRWFSSANKLE